ncbi:hypothetical protein [Naasia sp. SYSU D00948]|uniref:hypothetical protein n=1 Tax=Naasia sp. SYSU D00948 TaxID=2817379 RepID=UPI001B30F912|nr:hypothetical protein [Naasia sp. SYSU D00948]
MHRRRSAVVVAVLTSLLLGGCAGATAHEGPSHVMPDGGVMPGAEHGAEHGAHPSAGEKVRGPSDAALMVCEGQVPGAVAEILGLASLPNADWSWDDPMFRCTYRVDGLPLVLSVHDASEPAEGEEHFRALRESTAGAAEIEGMAGFGMPSFSSPEGIAAFLRDGKTLTVDATALPDGLGPEGSRSPQQVAYTIASAVLACWVEHD